MPRGGYQKPSNPAPSSGPGKMSKRTDGGPAQPVRDVTGGAYGDNQELRTLQKSAPLNSSGLGAAQVTQPSPVSQPQGPEVVPLGAPSQRPDEPVTAGSPEGPGPGAPPTNTANEYAYLKAYLPVLTAVANGPQGSPSLRKAVRYLKGGIPQ